VLDGRAAPTDEDTDAGADRMPATGYSAAAPQGLAR
jgi:hypothetical protein